MALEKWHPLKELESMRREMDRMWDELFPASRRFLSELPWRGAAEKAAIAPAIDIVDRPNEVIVKAEMPGVAKDDIEISVQENSLTISGRIQAEKEAKEENYYYRERGYNSYSRTVEIPFKVSPEKIKAGLKDGILTIHLPKAEEVQPKRIKVEVG